MSQETIEKKLEYLDETKQMLGQALVTKGQTINNETPFRDYVQKVLDIQTGFDTRDATAVASEVLKGKTFYNSTGKVEGTLVPKTGDIKKFETIEEMQNDTNAQEGDLAVVYRSEIQNATVDSQFQIATFSKTIVLDTAVTSSIRIYYYPVDTSVMFDCMGSLSATRFSLDCYSDTGSFRITYTSTDGITYTRTDTLDETIDFGTLLYYAMPEYWDDRIGDFIKCGGMYFEGLYQYALNQMTDFIQLPDLTKAAINYATSNGSLIYNGYLDKKYNVKDLQKIQFSGSYGILYVNTSNKLKIVCGPTSFNRLIVDTNNKVVGLASVNTDVVSARVYEIDEQTWTLQNEQTINTITYNSNNYKYVPLDDIKSAPLSKPTKSIVSISTGLIQLNQVNWVWSDTISLNTYINCYMSAPSQLTLNLSNEILKGKTAYGKSGVVTGDGSIADNLDIGEMISYKTESNLYEKGCYLITDLDVNTLGITDSSFEQLDYYKNGICLQEYKINENLITIAADLQGRGDYFKVINTASCLILWERIPDTSYEFYIYDKDLNPIINFSISQTSDWTPTSIVENEAHTKLVIGEDKTNTSMSIITVDLINKTYNEDVIPYGGKPYGINFDEDGNIYWICSYLSGYSGYPIGVFKNNTLLAGINNAAIYNSNYNCIKIKDKLYFAGLSGDDIEDVTDRNERTPQNVYTFDLSTNTYTVTQVPSAKGYLIRCYDFSDNEVQERPAIFYSFYYAVGLVLLTENGWQELELPSDRTGFNQDALNENITLYVKDDDYVLMQSNGYYLAKGTEGSKLFWGNKLDSDLFNSYEPEWVPGIGTSFVYRELDTKTGIVMVYNILHDKVFGQTDENSLIKLHQNNLRHLVINNNYNWLLNSTLSNEEYQTALDTALDIRDGEVE